MGLPNPITAIGDGIKGAGDLAGKVASGAVSAAGDTVEMAEQGAKNIGDFAGDRAHDLAAGDPFGVARRDREAFTQEISEKLSSQKDAIEKLSLGQSPVSAAGKAAGASVDANAALGKLHLEHGGSGPEIKDADVKTGPDAAKGKDSSYTVQEGDTLSEIAQKKGQSLDAVLGRNPSLGDGNTIKAGQEISLGETKTDSPTKDLAAAAGGISTPTPEAGPDIERA